MTDQLRDLAAEAFKEAHDRAYWHDSNRTHAREWDDCPDPGCVERRAALRAALATPSPDTLAQRIGFEAHAGHPGAEDVRAVTPRTGVTSPVAREGVT